MNGSKWAAGVTLCMVGSLQAATFNQVQAYDTLPVVGIDNVQSMSGGLGLSSQYTDNSYLCFGGDAGQTGFVAYQFTALTGSHFDGDFSVDVDMATLNLYGAGGFVAVSYKLDDAAAYTELKSVSSVGLGSGSWDGYSGTLNFSAQNAQNVYVKFDLGTEWYRNSPQLRSAAFTGTEVPVPEPVTVAMLAFGVIGLLRRRA